jgi:hypothetical protein
MTVVNAAKTLKGVSSTWINEQRLVPGRFKWQDGYGAFTVRGFEIPRTVNRRYAAETHNLLR